MKKTKKERTRLGWPFFYFYKKTRRIGDAHDTSWHEIFTQVATNFVWGFLGNLPGPFITKRFAPGVCVSFLCYYYTMTFIMNRPGYTTKFGKLIIFPIPPTIGAILSYYVGYWIIDHLQ